MHRRTFTTTLLGFGLLALARPAWSQASSQAGQTRGGGPNAERDRGDDCCGDSHDDMRTARERENARQRAIRTPQNQPDDGGWGSNTRDISASKDGNGTAGGAGYENGN